MSLDSSTYNLTDKVHIDETHKKPIHSFAKKKFQYKCITKHLRRLYRLQGLSEVLYTHNENRSSIDLEIEHTPT